MARVNYQRDKRQRDLARQRKQEEKRQKKLTKDLNPDAPAETLDGSAVDATDDASSPATESASDAPGI